MVKRRKTTTDQQDASGPSTDDPCRQLKDFIDGEQAAASFSCGGTITVDKIGTDQGGTNSTSPPVLVFWSPSQDTSARKLVLPLDESTPEATPQVLHDLVASCDPASFGLGDKDVLDPAYRKAGKINPDQFATSFHPADFGILESIEKVLLPSISEEVDNILQYRKIKAELYKLNVYSGPSGLFRKHVDTPRSDSQVGSLVVCLPSAFEGGSLVVQHGGQVVEFDWSEQSSSTIQWAAFYSDCEHEIKTITHGDRITLTYNLFVTEPVSDVVLSSTPIVDPQTLPLHGWMKALLAGPDFMEKGGILGMFCSHAYPHSSELVNLRLPRALKGADLVLYSVFKSLGIELKILPIFDRNGVYGANAALGIKGTVGSDKYWGGYYTDDDSGDDDGREGKKPYRTRVGKELEPYRTHESTDDMNGREALEYCFPIDYISNITWITEPKHKEMAFSYIVHGNEPGIETKYSCVAILATIPPANNRKKMKRIME